MEPLPLEAAQKRDMYELSQIQASQLLRELEKGVAGPDGIRIHDVAVRAVVLGLCGPGNIRAGLDTRGKITIAGAALPGLVPCSVSATLNTNPHLVIGGH